MKKTEIVPQAAYTPQPSDFALLNRRDISTDKNFSSQGYWKGVALHFLHDRRAMTGLVIVLLILRLGSIMSDDVTHVLMFYNEAVYDVGDVLGTYLYRQGIGKMQYSYTTAAGLFQSGIGMILILITNKIAHMMGERGIW